MIEMTRHVLITFFYLWQMMSYFSRIEALEFLCNSACVQPVTADVFPAITDTRTKSVQKQIVEYDIKSTVDKLT